MLGSYQRSSKQERSVSVSKAVGVDEVAPGGNRQRSSQGAKAEPRQRARRINPKTQLFVTFSHWAIVILLTISLLTGMRIGWAYEESALGGHDGLWGSMLGMLSPRGVLLGINLIELHIYAAFLMLLVAGIYTGYMVRTGSTRRLKVTGKTFTKLFDGLGQGQFLRNKVSLWSANLLVYWIAFLFVTVLTLTGIALYRVDLGLTGVLGSYDALRLIHGLIAYLLIPYTILHTLLQWFFGRFWTIFKTKIWWPHIRAGFFAVVVCSPVVAGLYLLDRIPTTLTAPLLSADLPAPVLDGDASDPAWTNVDPVMIRTVKGANDPDHVDIAVKALHDGEYVYFQFQWTDADVSYKRYPLQKTEEGWKMLQTAYERADENLYYEDKLSLYITDVPNGTCASTCHLGVGPYSETGDKHGLHYTEGEVGDVWHWKSVRTNPLGDLSGDPGFLDDQHFGPAQPLPTDPKERYTGGYYPDPNEGGGYAYNYTKVDPDKPIGETTVIPQFLPPGGLVYTDPDATTSELDQIWWIHKEQAIPYTEETDTYPVGSIIPNIVISPLTGDRGDVRGKAEWSDGRWTLEARRQLDTGSENDVAFVPGEPVYITVATYNRTQTRHGEHITPVRVMLEE